MCTNSFPNANSKQSEDIHSVAIHLEPRIRTARKNSLFLSTTKHFSVKLFQFARLASCHIFAYLSPRTIVSAMSYFRPPYTRHGKQFFACLFLESVKC